MIEEKFPERFTWAREAAGLSQSEVARRIVPRITPQSVQQWEAGTSAPRPKRLRELARVFGVRERWLAFGELPVHEGDANPNPGDPVGAAPTPADWRAAVTARLPPALRAYAGREPLPGFPVLYASPTTLADVSDAADARTRLWRLLILARLLGAANPHLRVLLFVPPDADAAQLQWEAHTVGLAVIVAPDPGAIAEQLSQA